VEVSSIMQKEREKERLRDREREREREKKRERESSAAKIDSVCMVKFKEKKWQNCVSCP
jgi:hypothetical protein